METLVLSASYEPVSRVPWQRAITLIWENKVEVIEEYENRWVHSVTLEFRMPSVIRFLKAVRGRKRAIKFSRENVFARDNGRCQYCSVKLARAESTYDHVIPRAMGGHTRWENVVIACYACNQKKGCKTPEQAKMKLLTLPIKPKKLPDTLRLTFQVTKDTPDSWKQWIASVSYWNTELDQD